MIKRLQNDSRSNKDISVILKAIENRMLLINDVHMPRESYGIEEPMSSDEFLQVRQTGKGRRASAGNIARDLGDILPPLNDSQNEFDEMDE
jgi:hypothetical protein